MPVAGTALPPEADLAASGYDRAGIGLPASQGPLFETGYGNKCSPCSVTASRINEHMHSHLFIGLQTE
jgi:hypothetical protein